MENVLKLFVTRSRVIDPTVLFQTLFLIPRVFSSSHSVQSLRLSNKLAHEKIACCMINFCIFIYLAWPYSHGFLRDSHKKFCKKPPIFFVINHFASLSSRQFLVCLQTMILYFPRKIVFIVLYKTSASSHIFL